MKKQIALIGIVSAFSFIVFLSACKKDEEKAKQCTCTETGYGDSYTKTVDPASFGASNCGDLATKLNMQSQDYYYSCH